MSKSRILFFLLLLACLSLKGQQLNENQKEFLDSVALQYQQVQAYSIEVEVRTIDEAGKPIGSAQKYLTARQENNYVIQTPWLTRIIGEDFQLHINHVEYWIQYSTLNEADMTQFIEEQISISVPKFNFEDVAIDYQETSDELIIRPLEQLMGATVSYRFDKKRKLLTTVVYDYNPEIPGQAKSVEIEYQNFQFDGAVDASLFQLEQYLNKRNGAWQCSEAYRDYQLIKTPTNEQ